MQNILELLIKNPILFLPLGLILIVIILKIKSSQADDVVGSLAGNNQHKMNHPQTWETAKVIKAPRKNSALGIIIGILVLIGSRVIPHLKTGDWGRNKDNTAEVRTQPDRDSQAPVDLSVWESFQDTFSQAIENEDWDQVLSLMGPDALLYDDEGRLRAVTSVSDLSAIKSYQWTFIKAMSGLLFTKKEISLNGRDYEGYSFDFDADNGIESFFYLNGSSWVWGGLRQKP